MSCSADNIQRTFLDKSHLCIHKLRGARRIVVLGSLRSPESGIRVNDCIACPHLSIDLLDIRVLANNEMNGEVNLIQLIKGIHEAISNHCERNCFLEFWALECHLRRSILANCINKTVFLEAKWY